ncbi:MAG: hypothetical protein EPN62_08655 [Candidimonas sp.]|nr:MAG: hypothetical protein EPN62_08655 [Candidimonas sp.]
MGLYIASLQFDNKSGLPRLDLSMQEDGKDIEIITVICQALAGIAPAFVKSCLDASVETPNAHKPNISECLAKLPQMKTADRELTL